MFINLWFRLNRIDRILVTASAVVIALASTLLVFDDWIQHLIRPDETSRAVVGTTSSVRNDVRTRPPNVLVWSPMFTAAKIRQGDAIFTGQNSGAVIELIDGDQIELGPNSLIVMSAEKDQVDISIDQGSMTGRMNARQKKIKVRSASGAASFLADGADFSVSADQSRGASIRVLKGEIELQEETGVSTVIPEGSGPVSPLSMSSEVEPLTPAQYELVTPDLADPLFFSWRGGPPRGAFRLQIASDPQFQKLLHDEATTRESLKVKGLPENQDLYWRVQSDDRGTRIYSKVQQLRIVDDTPANILFPRDQQVMVFEQSDDQRELEVTMHWRASSPAKKGWIVQLSKRSDFATVLAHLKSDAHSVALTNLIPSTYYLRVRSQDWQQAPWSNSVQFQIVARPPAALRPPQVAVESSEFQLVTRRELNPSQVMTPPEGIVSNLVEAVPQLVWNSVPGALGYQIEIFQMNNPMNDFSNPLLRESTNAARYTWESARPGQFAWRVRASLANGELGPPSEPTPLTISVAPPVSLVPPEVIESVTTMTQINSPPDPFVLYWSPVVFSAKYVLEFSSSAEFKNPLRLETQNNFKRVQTRTPGNYFWRVRALYADNRPLTEWTPPITYSYKRQYLSPENIREVKPIYPNQETLLVVGDGVLRIPFRWATPLSEKVHRLQVSANPEFAKILFDTTSTTGEFVYAKPLPNGKYYWRVRPEIGNDSIPWTEPSSFTVQTEREAFSFSQSETLGAKRIQAELERQKLQAKAPETSAPPDLGPTPNSPEDLTSDELVLLESRGPDVINPPKFEWSPVPQAQAYVFEVAPDPTFKSLAEKIDSNRPGATWPRPRLGKFYWRVTAIGPKGATSAPSETKEIVIQTRPPKLTSPHAMATPKFVFSWEKLTLASAYEVTWSANPTMKNPEKALTRQTQFSPQDNVSEKLYWQIRPLNAQKEPAGPPSQVRPVLLLKPSRTPATSPPISTTSLLLPENETKIEVESEANPLLEFSWESEKAGTFLLEVSRDSEFRDVFVSHRTAKIQTALEIPSGPGRFYWRVRNLDSQNPSEKIEARSFRIVETMTRQPSGKVNLPRRKGLGP